MESGRGAAPDRPAGAGDPRAQGDHPRAPGNDPWVDTPGRGAAAHAHEEGSPHPRARKHRALPGGPPDPVPSGPQAAFLTLPVTPPSPSAGDGAPTRRLFSPRADAPPTPPAARR